MGKVRFKYKEVSNSIKKKVPGQWRSGKESNAAIVIDGVEVGRVTLPKEKGDNKDIPVGTLNSIRKQLLLRWDQFADLVNCPMTATDYIETIKTKEAGTFKRN